MELLDPLVHWKFCFQFFEKPPYSFPQQLYHFTFLPTGQRVPIFSHLYQYLLFSGCFFFIVAILMDMRWYHIIVLIFLMISDVDFHMLIDHSYIFFAERSIQIPLSFLYQIVCFFSCWILEVPSYSGWWSLIGIACSFFQGPESLGINNQWGWGKNKSHIALVGG